VLATRPDSPAADVSYASIFRTWVVWQRRPQPGEKSQARRPAADRILHIGSFWSC